MNGLIGKEVHIDDSYLHVELTDGRKISTPVSWYPELETATINQIRNYRFICGGSGIEWVDIDYHLDIHAMMLPVEKNNIAA